MEREDELLRALMNGSKKTAPAGFTETVMQQVRELEKRRIYRRLVLTIVLRTALFIFLLLLLVLPLALRWINIGAPQITIDGSWFTLDGLWRLIGEAGQWAAGLQQNAYLLLPLLVLLFGRKAIAIK